MADCGLPQLLIGQAIIPVIGCIRIGVIERPELVIGKCLIRTAQAAGATADEIRNLIDNLKVDRNQTAKKLGLSTAREEV